MADDKDNEREMRAKRAQRARNLAVALLLGALVIIFYVATVVRLGPNVLDRPL